MIANELSEIDASMVAASGKPLQLPRLFEL